MRILRALTIFAAIIQALALISCTNEAPVTRKPNHLDNLGLKGYVRTIIESGYDAIERRDGIVKGSRRFTLIYSFNESGNTTESQVIDSTGRVYSRLVFRYNETGQLSGLDDYSYRRLRSGKVYSYDATGKETECSTILPDGSTAERIVKRYDQKGRKIEEIQEIPDSGIVSRYVSEYDTMPLPVKTTGFRSDSSVIDIMVYNYDVKGRLVSAITRDSDSSLVITETYDYDEEGKIIRESSAFGDFSRVTTYRYGMYDRSGNWLMRVEKTSVLHAPVEILLRERGIEYYPE